MHSGIFFMLSSYSQCLENHVEFKPEKLQMQNKIQSLFDLSHTHSTERNANLHTHTQIHQSHVTTLFANSSASALHPTSFLPQQQHFPTVLILDDNAPNRDWRTTHSPQPQMMSSLFSLDVNWIHTFACNVWLFC